MAIDKLTTSNTFKEQMDKVNEIIDDVDANGLPDGDAGDITVGTDTNGRTLTINDGVVDTAKLSTDIQSFVTTGNKGDITKGTDTNGDETLVINDGVLGIKVSDNDTTPDFLENKLLAGAGISLTTQNDGGNETRTVAIDTTGATDGQVLTADGAGGAEWSPIPGVPIGMISAFPVETLPDGWLVCNGATFDQTTYPELYTFLGNSNVLPDLRGEFIRGWDNGRGIDSGRVLGSSQADAYKSHSHTNNRISNAFGSVGGIVAYSAGSNGNGTVSGGSSYWSTTSSGGNETRPRNVAMVYAIKAFDGVVNEGSVDIAGLTNDVATNTADITSLDNKVGTGAGVAKAWILFNGTGTISITNDYNVSTIADLGTGRYRINFSTSMANSSYAVTASARATSTSCFAGGTTVRSNSYVEVDVRASGGYVDSADVNFTIHGD